MSRAPDRPCSCWCSDHDSRGSPHEGRRSSRVPFRVALEETPPVPGRPLLFPGPEEEMLPPRTLFPYLGPPVRCTSEGQSDYCRPETSLPVSPRTGPQSEPSRPFTTPRPSRPGTSWPQGASTVLFGKFPYLLRVDSPRPFRPEAQTPGPSPTTGLRS